MVAHEDRVMAERKKQFPDRIREKSTIVVVGGVNVDICASPKKVLIAQDSNPGVVTISFGGVGRNIAHNLRLLDQPVRLITVFSGDIHATGIRANCRELDIDVSASLTVVDASTSSYVFITDEHGEMQLAVADMEIYKHMTPAFIADKLDVINQARLCVVDTNIPKETLEFLAESVTVPLFVDPVSITKMDKLQNILGRIHTFKPNKLEAEHLTGIPITDEHSLRLAAERLLDTGIKRVYITLGSDGVFCADWEQKRLLPCFPSKMRNATGGGDAFMAGLAFAYTMGMPLEESAQIALAASAICIEGEQTVNDRLSKIELYNRAGLFYPEDEAERK